MFPFVFTFRGILEKSKIALMNGIDSDKVSHLIEKYRNLQDTKQVKDYNEEETKIGFILPLFEALGWNINDKYEVSSEEQQSGGRVDHGFYLNGRVKFYLEAKSLKVDLNREEFANQAIRYSWNKGVTWAILTDFESTKVFNAQVISENLGNKLFFEIKWDEYLDRIDQLSLLSRNSFIEGLLDKDAEKHGKKLQTVSVGASLYKDLKECREILTKSISAWNPKVHSDLLDEGVQKLLDRLIFIRVAEDRGVESEILVPMVRQWQPHKGEVTLFKTMIEKFRELDDIYNSSLFSPHPFEEWDEFSDATAKVVDILYGKKGYYEYDFKLIPSDVLGAVYENYLGYKLSKSKKGLSVDKDSRKRKEQGIYYTPSYIVDYIVENALKPILDKCTSVDDLKRLKVLDPACGSGSFLIKALELIFKKYQYFGFKDEENTKIMILSENIYGVDLDSQAVEIARLNLLIGTLQQRIKLPSLIKNIKNGNSLISGTDEELKKYFGNSFRDNKPFNWEEEFPEVFKQGGFDVIIGNPPWGANTDLESEYFSYKYPQSVKEYKDTYKMFIDKGIQILAKNGILGFVVPNTFMYQPRYKDIKEYIDKFMYVITNLGEKIFKNVELPCCVLVLTKVESSNHQIVNHTNVDRNKLALGIQNDNYIDNSNYAQNLWKKTNLILDEVLVVKDGGVKHQRKNVGKAEKGKSDLRDRIYYTGKLESSEDHALLIGSDIDRYKTCGKPTFVLKSNYKSLLHANEIVYFDQSLMTEKNKILWRQTSDHIKATLVNDYWFANTLQCGILRPKYKSIITLEYCLAILNSRYFKYLYQNKVLEAGRVFPQVKLQYLRPLPFVVGSKQQIDLVSELVKKILNLNCEEVKLEKNSGRWSLIKEEIVKIDKLIDNEVYGLYKLSKEEILVVENN